MSDTTSWKEMGMCIYSQNVNRKYIFTSTLLEELQDLYDILFFQEPPWQTVRHSASMKSKKGEPVKGPPLHPHWIPIIPKVIDARIDHLCAQEPPGPEAQELH